MTRTLSLEIIICTYNNAALLERTLQALAEQQVPNKVHWRVLVVDNNCSDATPQVVQACASAIPVPVTRIVETRQGLTPARQCGVAHSEADWIAFVDDDCLLAPDWVAHAADFAALHPLCGAFGGKVLLQWETPPPPHVQGYGYAYAETDLGDVTQQRDWLAGAGMVIRRAAIAATGWIEQPLLEDRIGKRLVSGGDVEIGLRIAAQFEVWYVPACRLYHVIPARRTSRTYLRRMIFGLGISGHDTGAASWSGSYFGWWLAAWRRSATFLAQALRRLLRDVRRSRAAFDPGITLAFVVGWWVGMSRFFFMGRARRQQLLGAFVRGTISTPEI